MSTLLEVSFAPMDKGESVGEYVAKVLDVIDKSGISYKLGPMGTCLEGEWDEVMGVVKQCFDVLKEESNRIYITMKADYRKGKEGSLNKKIATVEQRLGRSLNK